MVRSADSNDPTFRAGSAYPTAQLQRALEAAVRHEDPELRRRAEQRALAWEEVISGIASGTLQIGSRTPVEGTPAWVTLEVAHGGFATGRYVAEGTLQPWEDQLLTSLPRDFEPGLGPRHRLNSWHLTDSGLERLQGLLADRTYAVDVPEEGALLVVAWLMGNGYEEAALDVVAELYPVIDRLRFYPRPTDRPIVGGAIVHLNSAGEVARRLQTIDVPEQIATMRDAISVWNPLLDRLISLWVGTYADDWPCQRWPETWEADRETWLADYAAATSDHPRSRHLNRRSTFTTMRQALERCPQDSSDLSERDVGRLRKAVEANVNRRGVPGSDAHVELRRQQNAVVAQPTYHQIAAVVAERLAAYPSAEGIAELDPVVEPVELEGGPAAVPPAVVRKVERVREAPVQELVDREVIGSAEVLAAVLPQISSQVAAAGIEDPQLQALYSQIYKAFRGRRSLLLLNLEHQVLIEELPWVDALDRLRTPSQTAQRSAGQTLSQTALLAVSSFPQTILPNPLVKELSALATHAGLDIPFVEEVAADIFMGTFTTKWRRAAHEAATLLEGTLYARYYDLPTRSTWAHSRTDEGLLDKARVRWGKQTADDFAGICHERAKEAGTGDGSFVARNGTVIEQSQILTTHNLAQLTLLPGVQEQLAAIAPEAASDAFTWIVRQQTTARPDWRSRLQTLKNTAYAWRQALFLLSLTEDITQQQVIDRWRQQWSTQPEHWRTRFDPVLIGLELVSAGDRFDKAGTLTGGRRFLGWSVGPHWLSPPPVR